MTIHTNTQHHIMAVGTSNDASLMRHDLPDDHPLTKYSTTRLLCYCYTADGSFWPFVPDTVIDTIERQDQQLTDTQLALVEIYEAMLTGGANNG